MKHAWGGVEGKWKVSGVREAVRGCWELFVWFFCGASKGITGDG